MAKTILVVEDDDAVREVVTEALEVEGHRVVACPHGAAALQRLRAGLSPDLILLDLMMPVMNGWQFREAQLADPRFADIPVIVMTAAGSIHDIQAMTIRKPFMLDDLLGVVASE